MTEAPPSETAAILRSPRTGSPLVADTPHSLLDTDGQRWPVLDAIPFLRIGREDFAREAVARLDRGDHNGALVELLKDQDDWWTGPAPAADGLYALVQDRDHLTLREAMARLAYDRVGDYFAHRWSDPTFLAGLALMEAHWNEPRSAFELACGIGHNLRELERRGVAVTGADVVFSKLWLARHWVVGAHARLVCFDAAAPWPIEGETFDLVLCCDAFYFLEPKREILAAMRRAGGDAGWLAVSHIHNADADTLSSGSAITNRQMAELFPEAVTYDDAELTRALAEARAPRPESLDALRDVEAFSVAAGAGLNRNPRALDDGLALPPAGAPLRRNPLYVADEDGSLAVAWPSARYEQEYGPRVTYPRRTACPERAEHDAALEPLARRRELVDLPERW